MKSSYLVDDVINFNIFLEPTSKAMADGKNRGEDKNLNIWRTKRAF